MDQTASSAQVMPAPAEPKEARPFATNIALALIYGVVAAIVCGIVWGLVCYLTNTNYFFLAIAVGFVVSLAATLQFQKVNLGIALILVVPCLILSVLAVALGDYLYYALVVMREYGLSAPEAVSQVNAVFVDVETSKEGAVSLVMGALGAIIGFYRAVRS